MWSVDEAADQNAVLWKSAEVVQTWAAEAGARERGRVTHRRIMAELLPFDSSEQFTFLDLGAGTGVASRAILQMYPNSTAVLADFSGQMMAEGARELEPVADRYRYVEFDMLQGPWPEQIPVALDAVVTSLCVHHLPDDRKQSLFAEIFDRLRPGGWYLNYDPVTADDPVVEATWQRVNDRLDPEAAHKRQHRSSQEQARYENHVRYMIPLDRQVAYLRAAGFAGVDVYWKHLENVIYGGVRPA